MDKKTIKKDVIPERPVHCGEKVVENTYHRAVEIGAVWYCWKCDSHFSSDMKKIYKWEIGNY